MCSMLGVSLSTICRQMKEMVWPSETYSQIILDNSLMQYCVVLWLNQQGIRVQESRVRQTNWSC